MRLIRRRIDISVAVAIPEGLLTPVVRQADKKSIVTIAKEVRELATRAIAWCAGILVVFAPIAVWLYRRKV